MIRIFIDTVKESLEKRLDYWTRLDLAVQADISLFLVQRSLRDASLCADSYFIASLYASVLECDLSADHYVAQVHVINPSYNPLQRYSTLLTQFHSSSCESSDKISSKERKVLQGLDRFSRRYPTFDYDAFCARYFPGAFAASSDRSGPRNILPFRKTA